MRRKNHIMRCIVLLAVAIAAPSSLAGTVVTFQQGDGSGFSDTDATYIDQNSPGSNFGTNYRLRVQGNNGHIKRALIRFPDIIGSQAGQVPRNAVIVSANLSIDVNSLVSSFDHSVSISLTDWDEHTVTWNNFGVGNGGTGGTDWGPVIDTFVPRGTPSAIDRFDVDVTDALQAWADGDDNFGLVFHPRSGTEINWRSEETSQWAPILTVEFQPIPTPAAALSGGAALCVHFSRRRADLLGAMK